MKNMSLFGHNCRKALEISAKKPYILFIHLECFVLSNPHKPLVYGIFFCYYAPMKKQMNFYIDGFNLFHSLRSSDLPFIKWLNLRSLCDITAKNHGYVVGEIHYFSAYANFFQKSKPEKIKYHKIYVQALMHYDVHPHMGKFRERFKHCPTYQDGCGLEFSYYEEKYTDVDLGATMVADAIQKKSAAVAIISNDTDFVPALKLIRERAPEVKIVGICPPRRIVTKNAGTKKEVTYKEDFHKELKDLCDSKSILEDKHLKQHILPESIKLKNGKTITQPAKYSPTHLQEQFLKRTAA